MVGESDSDKCVDESISISRRARERVAEVCTRVGDGSVPPENNQAGDADTVVESQYASTPGLITSYHLQDKRGKLDEAYDVGE